MKLLGKLICLCLLFFSCNQEEQSVVTIPNSINQWPMSGGPDGSWKVKTDLDVPVKWSVRTGENIKWKTTLPEGGQSGIAVWDDKLFLTINPPVDTPKYSKVLEVYKEAKLYYDSLFNEVVNRLKLKKDKQFLGLKKAMDAPESAWKELLKNHKHYQSVSDLEKPSVYNNLMRKTEQGKAFSKKLNLYKAYVHVKSKDLIQANSKLAELNKLKRGGATGKDILLLCIDANTGETLWQKAIKGTLHSAYNYGFSDATTPCPITDGTNVWGINASGGMACFTINGDLVWERTWEPSTGRPFNKQFDSILFEDLILNVEPPVEGDTTRNGTWNYLHAFNKRTGERVWVTKEALTHYNTPVLGETFDGKPAVMIGRGGPHGVPERPVGLNLISLEKEKQGKALWNWEPEEANKESGWGALSTQHWNANRTSWFFAGDHHLTVDSKTGKQLTKKELNLTEQYVFNKQTETYEHKSNVRLHHHQNQRHCNIMNGDNLFYMVRYKPFMARHNMVTGKNEQIELPHEIDDSGNFIWGQPQKNDGLNAQGQLHTGDPRTRGDGFQKCFLGSPTMINNYIYFTNALGLVYVIDANAETFNASALVAVNDLGERGQTWSVNSLSFANGHIYHRTMKELICIGDN
ncbi:PQQ-binding-like beta-propeller repeat protein [Seonamhaeicola marinus]|uniref:Serine/threonine protein kinase related protein n=1 Tax=Seonamhaeicola marinus TaxID=1912246 RepID=A0A5D0HUW9_9FLAO|nr:PQQ-binding-like beta-propeller repeat protein [Seonamhaeicola marinus]TYA74660.1 serine/threonine protein kinase related protein [Seonamhaeicola marinus]